MTDDERSVRLEIYGRVQGVFYRASTRKEAQRLGLRGWVRNRSDGSVEALAAGPREAVDALIAWTQKGPPLSRVDRVDVQELEDGDLEDLRGLEGFEVRRH